MGEEKQFYQFFLKELSPPLEYFENARLRLASKIRSINIILILLFGVITAITQLVVRADAANEDTVWLLRFIAFLGSTFVYFLIIFIPLVSLKRRLKKRFKKKYGPEYKELVINKLLAYSGQDFHVDYQNGISKDLFIKSELFPLEPDYYKSEDLFTGEVEQAQVQFGEVIAKYQTQDSDGKNVLKKIFNGIFCVAKFPHTFPATFQIIDDQLHHRLELIGKDINQQLLDPDRHFPLLDPAFDEVFEVYGDDKEKIIPVLTDKFKQRILSFKKKYPRAMSISFADHYLFATLATKGDNFDITPNKSLLQVEKYRNEYELLHFLMESINSSFRAGRVSI